MSTLAWDYKTHTVCRPDMDETHEAFIDLVNAAINADQLDFLDAYDAIITHTQEHFATEEALMDESGFGATAEHKAEHARVLRDFNAFRRFAAKGMMNPARAFLKGAIPEWLALHLTTMDMALAVHANKVDKSKKVA